MAFDDRLIWLVLGIVIGYLLGYLTRVCQDYKDSSDDLPKDSQAHDNERGVVNTRVTTNIALLVVVILAFWASIQAQRAVNQVTETQARLDGVAQCNKKVLIQALNTLNARTISNRDRTSSNFELQKAQSVMLGILLHRPPYTEVRREQATKRYVIALDTFITANDSSDVDAKENPYPKASQLASCIADGR